VTVGGNASIGSGFTVVAAPAITSLSPPSGLVGASVTIQGIVKIYVPPPPPLPPNHSRRNAWIVVGVVVAIAGVVAGIVAVSGGSDSSTTDARPSASVSGIPTGLPSGLPTDLSSLTATPTFTAPSDGATPDLPTDLPSDTATSTEQLVPYVVLAPGKCFDSPTLSPSLSEVTTRSCGSAHDAEVVANETLSGTFTSDEDIQTKALELCTTDAKKHLPADGKLYYPYALFPKLITYEMQGRDTVTCSLTRNNGSNSVKLYNKLG